MGEAWGAVHENNVASTANGIARKLCYIRSACDPVHGWYVVIFMRGWCAVGDDSNLACAVVETLFDFDCGEIGIIAVIADVSQDDR